MKLDINNYAKLFESAPIALSLNDINGKFLDVNNEFLKITGYTKDEFLTLSHWDLTPKKYEKQEEQQLESLENEKKYGPYEKEYIHKQGYLIYVLLNGTLIEDDNGEEIIYSTIQEISKAKKSEQVLNKAQELGNIGHWYLDLTTGELSWSDETYRIFGLKPQEFAATYEAFVERIYDDDRDAVNSAYSNSLEVDKPYQIEHRVIRPNKEIRYVIERCEHYHDNNGKIIGSIGAVIDITECRENENKLKEEKDKAESANIAKSSFIANMSHELRTPLNAILGFSENIAKDRSLNEKNLKHITIVNSSGKHLLNMINEILDMSKIEAGEMKISNSEFNLLETIKGVSDAMIFQVDQNLIKCSLNIDKELPKFIVSDEGKIKQILYNLIGNAVKFTEKGSITLSVTSKKIPNSANKIDLNISLADTGHGIEANMLDNIFKPFIQNDGIKKNEGGTGLGLTISKNILKILDGKISVTSEVGKGSTFIISLPVTVTDNQKVEIIENENLQSSTNDVSQNINKLDFENISQDIIDSILKAATIGSAIKIKKELIKIENTNKIAFKHLAKLTKDYNFDEIINTIKEHS